MAIFPLAPDQTIAQMWSNGARGGFFTGQKTQLLKEDLQKTKKTTYRYTQTIMHTQNDIHKITQQVPQSTTTIIWCDQGTAPTEGRVARPNGGGPAAAVPPLTWTTEPQVRGAFHPYQPSICTNVTAQNLAGLLQQHPKLCPFGGPFPGACTPNFNHLTHHY